MWKIVVTIEMEHVARILDSVCLSVCLIKTGNNKKSPTDLPTVSFSKCNKSEK